MKTQTKNARAAFEAAQQHATEARAAVEAARATDGRNERHAEKLARLNAEIAHIRAIDALALAERDAAPDAVSVDLESIAADLRVVLAEADRLEALAAAAKNRAAQRIAAAHEAHERIAAERSAAALPAPLAIPTGRTAGAVDRRPLAVLIALEAALAGDVSPVREHGQRIRKLEREADQVRATLEEERIEAEARKERIRQEERRKTKADEREREEASQRTTGLVNDRVRLVRVASLRSLSLDKLFRQSSVPRFASIREAREEGIELPPIIVASHPETGQLRLIDGNHRLQTAREDGLEYILAEWIESACHFPGPRRRGKWPRIR